MMDARRGVADELDGESCSTRRAVATSRGVGLPGLPRSRSTERVSATFGTVSAPRRRCDGPAEERAARSDRQDSDDALGVGHDDAEPGTPAPADRARSEVHGRHPVAVVHLEPRDRWDGVFRIQLVMQHLDVDLATNGGAAHPVAVVRRILERPRRIACIARRSPSSRMTSGVGTFHATPANRSTCVAPSRSGRGARAAWRATRRLRRPR